MGAAAWAASYVRKSEAANCGIRQEKIVAAADQAARIPQSDQRFLGTPGRSASRLPGNAAMRRIRNYQSTIFTLKPISNTNGNVPDEPISSRFYMHGYAPASDIVRNVRLDDSTSCNDRHEK
jgi:hypothetical protein